MDSKRAEKREKVNYLSLIQKVMSHPQGIKGALPEMLNPAIATGQVQLKQYLHSIPLTEGETHCTVVTQFKDDGTLFFIVSAFKDKTFSRAIAKYSPNDLMQLIPQLT